MVWKSRVSPCTLFKIKVQIVTMSMRGYLITDFGRGSKKSLTGDGRILVQKLFH